MRAKTARRRTRSTGTVVFYSICAACGGAVGGSCGAGSCGFLSTTKRARYTTMTVAEG
ncbi:MAG: hypothetical protein ACLSG5_00880 [Oscillospiraceae bacterium]